MVGALIKIFIFLTFVILAGCGSDLRLPEASKTEFVTSVGAGFNSSRDDSKVSYQMSYRINPAIGIDVSYRLVFDHADPTQPPVSVEGELPPNGTDRFTIESPPFDGIRNPHLYETRLELFRGDKKIATHDQAVLFQLPPEIVTLHGLKNY